ncbi:hypothetical protein MMC24_003926 [Lignoscripta atroalba]|nr:hypothetical protein [Lignoscripta atroalba]
MNAAIEHLISSYHELNSSLIDNLTEEPSPLEFMSWPAVQKWDVQYLKAVLSDKAITVALTPDGNADSVLTDLSDGIDYFIKPLDVEEPFDSFLHYIQQQELEGDANLNVKYAQTQNDNLRDEYSELYQDVEEDIAWARIALARKPDAVNLWIGNSRSTTALHRDNYENIYCQVIGKKHFVLLPPVETACINERMLQSATYARSPANGLNEIERPLGRDNLTIKPDTPMEMIPFATWDPDKPEERPTHFSHLSQPLRIDLDPGDMLYLPALW